MNAHPQKLDPQSTVSDAISLMKESETSGLPIVREDGSVAAFISDGDILKRLARHNTSREAGESYITLLDAETMQERLVGILDLPAIELATRNVISVDVHDDAEGAFKALSERKIKKVPVLDRGVFVGTLSRRNIMKALALMEGAIAHSH